MTTQLPETTVFDSVNMFTNLQTTPRIGSHSVHMHPSRSPTLAFFVLWPSPSSSGRSRSFRVYLLVVGMYHGIDAQMLMRNRGM